MRIIAVFVLLLSYTTTSVHSDTKTYQSPHRRNCIPCPPGQKVDQHCLEDVTASNCSDCPLHHYSSSHNERDYCDRCHPGTCPKQSNEVQPCTTKTNRLCQCAHGYHKYPIDADDFFECQKHTVCKEGEAMLSAGTHNSDTRCGTCHGDEFMDTSTDNYPVCRKCSMCPENTTEITRCTPLKDTTCEDGNISTLPPASTSTTDFPQTSFAHTGTSAALSTGQIVGIVFGVITFIAIIIITVICCFIRFRRRSHNDGDNAAGCPPGIQITVDNNDQANGHISGPSEDVYIPLLSPQWTTEFISKNVFRRLSESLGHEWRDFIISLPGWDSVQQAQVQIDHAREEDKHRVKDQIYNCLMKWYAQCPTSVTKENILMTLRQIGRADICQELESMQPD